MKHWIPALLLLLAAATALAIPPVPAPPQAGPIAIVGATVHVGDGTVIERATVTFTDGRITAVGAGAHVDVSGHRLIDVAGQHLYPGLILPDSDLGLSEVGAIRATQDAAERGEFNPSVRSLVAYNTDSEFPPTLRFNGVLVAQVSPNGGLVAGRSSIVQLDAWNWEDAALMADDGLFLSWPGRKVGRFDWSTFEFRYEENRDYRRQVGDLEALFADARLHAEAGEPPVANVKLAAMGGLFDGTMRLFLRVDEPVDIVRAVRFAQRHGVERIVVIGADGLLDASEFLASHDIPVIVNGVHRLPEHEHDAIDAAYRLPAALVARGIRTGLTYPGLMNARNLPFIAGTVSAYGLDREAALAMVTKTNAEILGLGDRLGTIAVGKDATLFLSTGDALDMRTNDLTLAFISGREITLEGTQQELYRRYREKFAAE